MSEPEKQDPLILRCLKAAAGIDWKALALVLAALGGLGGAIWNRVDAFVEKAIAARTQQGVYEVLAQRMEEMSTRLEVLETLHTVKAPVPLPKPPVRGATPEPVEETAVPATAVDAVRFRSMQFKKSQLPSFQFLQKRAVDDDLAPVLQAAPASE
jgi:hypothetical protein